MSEKEFYLVKASDGATISPVFQQEFLLNYLRNSSESKMSNFKGYMTYYFLEKKLQENCFTILKTRRSRVGL